jgi:hypothetical protein
VGDPSRNIQHDPNCQQATLDDDKSPRTNSFCDDISNPIASR